jgi:hypothetical protein
LPLCQTGGEWRLAHTTSLDPLESKSQVSAEVHLRYGKYGSAEHDVEPITSQESSFRHSGWVGRRRLVWDSLVRTGTSSARLSRFANCGSGLWLEANQEQTEIRCRCNRCHDRWCIPCMTEKAARMRQTIKCLIDQYEPRFMTLTLRHSLTPLVDQVNRLYQCFNQFRRRSSWTSHVDGGAAFLEIKLSEKDGLWHVHLHCLVAGSWWDQREISREWHAITGDSSIVDVRRIHDAAGDAAYVTKYVTKVLDASVYRDDAKMDEATIAFRGRRLCTTFGSWRGQQLDAEQTSTEQWHSVGRIETLFANAREGDRDARRWVSAITRKWPLLAACYAEPPPTTRAAAEYRG